MNKIEPCPDCDRECENRDDGDVCCVCFGLDPEEMCAVCYESRD